MILQTVGKLDWSLSLRLTLDADARPELRDYVFSVRLRGSEKL